MISVGCKINPREFRRAFDRFAGESKKRKREKLRQQAKLFVRDVVRVTPPNKSNKWNRKGGEQTILNDLAHIVRPSRSRKDPDAFAIHRKMRTRNGRVNRRSIPVRARNVLKLKRELYSRVGILASGWNAAARRLGVTFPSWITRHGTRYGRCVIKVGASSMTIKIVNGVRFAGDVRGIERRVQWALNNRARQMDKQMDDYAVKQAARAAGLA